MQPSPLYSDPDLVARTTQYLVDKGDTVLQIHRLRPTQDEHIAALLKFFSPPKSATILDAGCGVGAVSAGMKALRQDLNFILLNNSEAQIKHCGTEFHRLVADMNKTPLARGSVDAVMMCYSIGHVDLNGALAEFSRVTRVGGMFYLYDLTTQDTARLEREMFYTAPSVQELMEATYAHGFYPVDVLFPETYISHFYDKMKKEDCDRVLAGVSPVLFNFVKVK